MTPLDKIERGILLCNWNLVSQGYFDLTGKDLTGVSNSKIETTNQIVLVSKTDIGELPKGGTGTEKVKKKSGRKPKVKIELPSAEEVSNIVKDVVEKALPPLDTFAEFRTPPLNPKPTGEGNQARKVPFKKVTTKFYDGGNEAMEDAKAFRKLNKKFKASARREEFQLVKLNCKTCGKEEEIPADLASKYGDGSADDVNPAFYCGNCR